MISKLKRVLKSEGGITGLETAIILIAFVVVAAVFAFTVLSAGVFSSEKGKEAVYAGLGEVAGSMEIKGSMIGNRDAISQTVDNVQFTLANVAGGNPIDLTAPTNNKVVIDYRDQTQTAVNLQWTLSWTVRGDTDDMLEEGELALITVPLDGLGTPLGINTQFAVEVKPPQGGVLVLERTTPSYMDLVMDFH